VTPPDTAAGGAASKRRRSKPTPPPDTPESEEFWRAYPCRDDKYRFRFAFAEALKKASAAELIAGARRYAAKRAGEDPKWTKLAVNWLREERWLDEPAPARVIELNGGQPDAPHRANGRRLNPHDEAIRRQNEMCERVGF